MVDAAGDRIRAIEIMIRQIDINTMYLRIRPCLTVLDLYDSYFNRFGRKAIV